MMNEKIMELVKNGDFANVEEFKEVARDQKDEVIDFLKWRAGGGHFKNECISETYIEACKSLLADKME